jgi:hypothetical protein
MEQFDSIKKMVGVVTMEVIRDGKHGPEVIHRQETHNTVVNVGKRQVLRTLVGLQTSLMKCMRIGTSGAAVSSVQTNLLSPIASTRKTFSAKTMSATAGGPRTLQIVACYASSAGSLSVAGIKEVCILNQITTPGGTALMRAIFGTSVNKTKSDKIKITYSLRIS